MNRTALLLVALFATATPSGPARAQKPEGGAWVTADHLAALVREALDERIQGSERDLRHRIDALSSRVRLRPCAGTPRVTLPGRLAPGRASAAVDCPGPVPWSVRVPFRLREWAEVVVARRALPRNAAITQADVGLEKRELDPRHLGALRRVGDAVGNRARHPLNAGEPVLPRHLSRPHLVSRGDQVVLEGRSGLVVIVTEGEALGAGTLHDRVLVRNVRSGRRLTGTVIGRGRVRIE